MGAAGLTALAALAGGLAVLGAREAVLSAPRMAGWVAAAARPLARAGVWNPGGSSPRKARSPSSSAVQLVSW